MFTNTRRAIVSFIRLLKGQDLESITKANNKQIEKLKVVVTHLDEDAKSASQQAELLRIAAINSDAKAKRLRNKSAEASVLKNKLDHLFTVSPIELETQLNKK